MLSRARGIVRREHDHRQVFVDQRVRPMLHFAGRIAFRVNVGNLLQLERAFERDREMNAAPKKKKIVRAEQLACQIFVLLIVGQNRFELAGYAHQLMHERTRAVLGQTSAYFGEIEGQNGQRRQLAGERFGGGNADLRARMRVDSARGFARDHGADDVADGERLRTFLLGFALGGEGVRGFARLRNHDGQHVGRDDGIAIAELAAVIHFDGNARQLLDHEFARERRMPARSAGDDLDFLERRELSAA